MTDIPVKNNLSRISIIDVLRGFALYGIILAHAASIYLFELQSEGRVFDGKVNILIKQFLSLFIERKFYLIFSFLFGFSFYIQFKNAGKRGQPFVIKFIWRLSILFIIGLLHNQFYPFDILHIYAIIGLLLIPIRRLAEKQILFITVLLIIAASISAGFGNHIKSSISVSMLADFGFSDRIIHQLSSGHFFMILGLFYLGYWAGLIGLFNTDKQRINWFKKIAIISFAILCLITFIGSKSGLLAPLKSLCLSFGYISCICLLYVYGRSWKLFWLALEKLGRMGLTNYVLQTLFFFAIFEFAYEYIKNGQLLFVIVLANLFYFFQIALSICWFRKLKYGPLEWLWRSTTNLYKNTRSAKKELSTAIE